MMGKRGTLPLALLDGFLGRPAVPEGTLYHMIAHCGAAQFEDEAFAGMYAERGRPSWPPSMMLKVVLLAFADNVSDREAEERCRFDLRWKYALGLRFDEEGPDATTLCRFRARLIVNDQAGAAFVRTLRWAREQKVLGRNIDELVDSTSVFGAGAVQDTLTLLRKARRKLAWSMRSDPQQAEWAKAVLAEPDEKPDIAWNDAAARQQALNALVTQAREALARTAADSLTADQQEARQLLQTVVGQDVEPDEDGGVRIRQGVAKDRVCSVTDPEMRHGHKTSSGRFDGHKVEIGMDRATELVTHVEVMAGNGTDGDHLVEQMTETEDALDVHIDRVIADTAYGRPAVREAMEARGTAVLAPVPVPHNRGLYTKEDFATDLEARTCQCPAGHSGRATFNQDGDLTGFRFQAKTCAACPLRAHCTTGQKQGRTVSIRPDETAYRVLRAEQETEAWKSEYRVRPRVEHKIAEIVHHGMRQARYIGRTKTRLQALMTAAVVNLKRLGVLVQGASLPAVG